MAQISVNDLTFCYEGSFDSIFENVSFSIDTDWKLGFIGRNGKGKTTFLNLLLGKYPYEGSIDTSVRFEYFPYRIPGHPPEATAADFLEKLRPGLEFWRVIRELPQIGENDEILYRPFDTLSFGERTKILLAVLFAGEGDFPLIDEPTNHLDFAARESVKNYLSSKKGFILVSHDRELLDACIDHVLVLNRKTIEVQSGNFSTWWENKRRRDQFAVSEDEKHRRQIQKLKEAARRTSTWADKSERTKIGVDPDREHDRQKNRRSYIGVKTKKMQSRAKQMERRIDREIQEKEGLLQDLERPVELKLTQMVHYKTELVRLQDFSFRYAGMKAPVFTGLDLSVRQGERIALHGANGCGKSTVIKRILQEAGLSRIKSVYSEAGICQTVPGLVISYVDQDTSGVRGGVSEYCQEHGLDRSLFCTVLRQLDFERSQFFKDMAEYSEGQKKKVLLAASMASPAHLYLWDEPLNYIDVFSRIQLETLLLEYRPTMLFVEHDARFREKVATKVVTL